MSKVLFLHHGRRDPSTRFRIYPWWPLLQGEGIRCEELPRRDWRSPRAASRHLRRVKGYVSVFETILDVARCARYDLVFVQRFLFPHRVARLDSLLRRSRHLILDVTDALFCRPDDDRPVYEARLRRLCGMADCVFASNAFMADWINLPGKTVIMPTVVDCDAIPVRQYGREKEKVAIGWIGQAYQLDYIRPLFGVLRDLARDPKVEVLFQTSSIEATAELAEIGIKIIPFDPSEENAVLRAIDIGLMPMPRTIYNLGKCPLKLIQHMASGAAVVCSPVGSNLEMVEDGIHGYFAETPADWHERLTALIRNPDARAVMGMAGRRRVEERYSTKAQWPRFRDAVVSLGAKPS